MMTTVLLPVYNDEKYIDFCLKSLLHQYDPVARYPVEFRCIIGFNGTVDRSKEIAQNTLKDDPRFTLVDFGGDKGKSKTLNKLLRMVQTERISLIDGDDMWMPTKIWSQARFHRDFDVIGSFAHYMDSSNSIISNKKLSLSIEDSDIKYRMNQGDNNIINSSCYIKTSDALEIGGWREDVEGVEDMDFWVRLMNKEKTFFNIPEYLVFHRIHQESNFNARELKFSPSDILKINELK